MFTPYSYPDIEYDMNDGTKMTIKQALEQAEEIIKKAGELGIMDKAYSLSLKTISIHDTGESGKLIYLYYTKKAFGLGMNIDGFFQLFNADGKDRQVRQSYFGIMFAGNNDPLKIINYCSDSIEEKEKTELKIKTYDEAKKALAEGFAKNLTYTVTEAGLRYTCVFSQLDRQHTYRPMWTFVLDDPTEKRNKDIEITDTDYFPRVTAYVDAINGDIYYSNPFNQTFSSSKAK